MGYSFVVTNNLQEGGQTHDPTHDKKLTEFAVRFVPINSQRRATAGPAGRDDQDVIGTNLVTITRLVNVVGASVEPSEDKPSKTRQTFVIIPNF